MMFRLREKLKYMVLGGLLTLAGFMFGNMNNNTEAQLGSQMIGKLTVSTLTVLDEIIVMGGQEPRVVITSNENGGKIVTYGRGGQAYAAIGIDDTGSYVITGDSKRKSGTSMSSNENGGVMLIRSADGVSDIILFIDDGGGAVNTTDRFGNKNQLD